MMLFKGKRNQRLFTYWYKGYAQEARQGRGLLDWQMFDGVTELSSILFPWPWLSNLMEEWAAKGGRLMK